jgi:hypothetical protein
MTEIVRLWWATSADVDGDPVAECWDCWITQLPPTPDNIGPIASTLPAVTAALAGVTATSGAVVGAVNATLPAVQASLTGLHVAPAPPPKVGGGNLRRRFYEATKTSGPISER